MALSSALLVITYEWLSRAECEEERTRLGWIDVEQIESNWNETRLKSSQNQNALVPERLFTPPNVTVACCSSKYSTQLCHSSWLFCLLTNLFGFSAFSNRSRIPPTCTSPICHCPWTSRSWRTCWSRLARPFLRASSVTPTEPVAASASPGRGFADVAQDSAMRSFSWWGTVRPLVASTSRTSRWIFERDLWPDAV